MLNATWSLGKQDLVRLLFTTPQPDILLLMFADLDLVGTLRGFINICNRVQY